MLLVISLFGLDDVFMGVYVLFNIKWTKKAINGLIDIVH